MRGDGAARPLLNGPESRLYGRLVRAFPGHVILSQVAMSQLLPANSPANAADAEPAGACERPAVASFVVCRPDFMPLAVIELDASSAAVPGGDERHRSRRLEAAGIKQIRVAAGDLPSEAALKALVAATPLGSSLSVRMRRAS